MKVPEPPFVGRQKEIAALQKEAERIALGRGEDSLFLSPRGRGKTTLLRRLKDLLFWGGEGPIPVYFSFSRPYRDLYDFCEEYLVSLLSQVLLFHQKERLLTRPDRLSTFSGLQKESERQGRAMCEELILLHQKALAARDEGKALLNALSAPSRLARSENKPVWMLVDHVQRIEALTMAGKEVSAYWPEALASPWAPHLFSGEPPGYLSKRFAITLHPLQIPIRHLPKWAAEEGMDLVPYLEERLEVAIARDLAGVWFEFLEGNPGVMTVFFREAARKYGRLESHRRFAEGYIRSLLQGEMRRWLEGGLVAVQTVGAGEGRYLLKGLHVLWKQGGEPVLWEDFQQAVGLPSRSAQTLLTVLERAGLVEESFGSLSLTPSRVLRDGVEVWIRQAFLQEKTERIVSSMVGRVEEELHTWREEEAPQEGDKGLRFGLVLPITPDSELVAVRALEQIAVYSDLEPDQVEKVKMALIEACINAGEHSGTFEQKIRVRFGVFPDSLEVTVEDRGQAFDPVAVQAALVRSDEPWGQKRGRGLMVIKEMMDEVRVEKTEVGTRLVMIKKYPKKEQTP